jgi:hypothetical protein
MANISSAYGKAKFIGNWEESFFNHFIKVFNEHLGDEATEAYYTIDFQNADFEKKEAIISGTGRWSFTNNLNNMHWWAYNNHSASDEEKEAHTIEWNTLSGQMKLNKLSVEIEFSDEECGCEMLYRAKGKIFPRLLRHGDLPQSALPLPGAAWSLFYDEESCEDYEYTREYLVELGLYNSEDFEIQLSDVSDELFEQFALVFPGEQLQSGVKVLTQEQVQEIKRVLNEQPFADETENIIDELSFIED